MVFPGDRCGVPPFARSFVDGPLDVDRVESVRTQISLGWPGECACGELDFEGGPLRSESVWPSDQEPVHAFAADERGILAVGTTAVRLMRPSNREVIAAPSGPLPRVVVPMGRDGFVAAFDGPRGDTKWVSYPRDAEAIELRGPSDFVPAGAVASSRTRELFIVGRRYIPDRRLGTHTNVVARCALEGSSLTCSDRTVVSSSDPDLSEVTALSNSRVAATDRGGLLVSDEGETRYFPVDELGQPDRFLGYLGSAGTRIFVCASPLEPASVATFVLTGDLGGALPSTGAELRSRLNQTLVIPRALACRGFAPERDGVRLFLDDGSSRVFDADGGHAPAPDDALEPIQLVRASTTGAVGILTSTDRLYHRGSPGAPLARVMAPAEPIAHVLGLGALAGVGYVITESEVIEVRATGAARPLLHGLDLSGLQVVTVDSKNESLLLAGRSADSSHGWVRRWHPARGAAPAAVVPSAITRAAEVAPGRHILGAGYELLMLEDNETRPIEIEWDDPRTENRETWPQCASPNAILAHDGVAFVVGCQGVEDVNVILRVRLVGDRYRAERIADPAAVDITSFDPTCPDRIVVANGGKNTSTDRETGEISEVAILSTEVRHQQIQTRQVELVTAEKFTPWSLARVGNRLGIAARASLPGIDLPVTRVALIGSTEALYFPRAADGFVGVDSKTLLVVDRRGWIERIELE